MRHRLASSLLSIAFCFAGALYLGCASTCPSGTPRCDGSVAHDCVDTGDKREEITDCAAQGGKCVLDGGHATCVDDRCDPDSGALRCSEDGRATMYCNVEGVWMRTAWECDPGTRCVQVGDKVGCQ